MAEDPTTQELRLEQLRREQSEREAAGEESGDATESHRRRADKAAYLREQLEKRAEAERPADAED